MRSPIIITGLPRAGIWLIAGAFEAAGAIGGNLERKAASHHSETFENIDIRDRLERPLLEGLRCDPRGLGKVPNSKFMRELAADLVITWRTLINLICTDYDPRLIPASSDYERFIASPVAILLWPLYYAAFPDAKWIIVRRSTDDVVASCKASGYLNGAFIPGRYKRVKTEDELRGLIETYEAAIMEMPQSVRSFDIWPQEIYEGDIGVLDSILKTCGLKWTPNVTEFLRPYLWKRGVLKFKEPENA